MACASQRLYVRVRVARAWHALRTGIGRRIAVARRATVSASSFGADREHSMSEDRLKLGANTRGKLIVAAALAFAAAAGCETGSALTDAGIGGPAMLPT